MKAQTEVDVMVLLGPKLSKHLNFELKGDVVVASPIRRLSNLVFNEIAKKVRELGGRWVSGEGFLIPVEKGA
jgi:hypothetical protein